LANAVERRRAIHLCAFAGLGAILETLSVGAVIPVMAALSAGQDLPEQLERWGIGGRISEPQLPLVLGSAFLVLFVVKTIYMIWLTRRQGQFVCLLEARVSQQLFDGYLQSSWVFHLQRNSSDLIQTVLKETFVLVQAAYASINLFIDLAVVAAIVLLLAVIEPVATFAAVIPMALVAFGFQRVVKARMVKLGSDRQRLESVRLKQLQHGLAAIRELLLSRRGEYFSDAYRVPTAQYASVSTGYNLIINLPRLLLELTAVMLLAAITAALIWFGRSPVDAFPALALFAAAALRVLPSLTRILGSTQIIRWASPAVVRIERELAILPEHPWSPSQGVDREAQQGDIMLEDVRFAYPGTVHPALDGVSLSIRQGSLVGLIGPSGSGKSTLMDIILGLLCPSGGSLRVGGRDVSHDLRAWQRGVGYVPQSITLLDDTLRRNVAFGVVDGKIDDERVWRALEGARLRQFVESLPKGLDTTLGERGARLSGGQRQRIGIARALYEDPGVLVLDEATSALDPATEAEIMETIQAFRGMKTVIIVAHRLSTVRPCDVIHRLESGRVVRSGCFEDVVGVDQA
jgi:ABC-type multidrug transport system fused ATPase/permease subunit